MIDEWSDLKDGWLNDAGTLPVPPQGFSMEELVELKKLLIDKPVLTALSSNP